MPRYRPPMGVLLTEDPAPGVRALVGSLTWRRVFVAAALATLVAALLSPIFLTSFLVLLARMLAIALMLLLVFAASRTWRARGVSPWLWQVLAVALAAPAATFVAYLPSVHEDVSVLVRHEGLLMGFIGITASVLVIAPLLALGALYRERDAQARHEALAFELERSTLERQALDARMKLLHAQIEPHFLFNTLANVQELVESGSPQAAPLLRSLIDYLRAAVPKLGAAQTTLGDELALVRAYLDLMRMRMPDRLKYTIDVPAALLATAFPSMALLTLVENAVRHGIDPAERGGRITVRAWRDAGSGRVHLAVQDSGVGIRETARPGTGLANLRERLLAFYGPTATLELREAEPQGVCAEMRFEAPAS